MGIKKNIRITRVMTERVGGLNKRCILYWLLILCFGFKRVGLDDLPFPGPLKTFKLWGPIDCNSFDSATSVQGVFAIIHEKSFFRG